mgnify:FL=1
MTNLFKILFIAIIFFTGCSDSPPIIYVPPGCMDSLACNYDANAGVDDGSCEYASCAIYGCTDSLACNYDFNANIDNGTCYDTLDGLSDYIESIGSFESDEGVCLIPENTIYITTEGKVFYNLSEEIGGFQFSIEGATVSSISGGDAEFAGFYVSGDSTILGVSFTGNSISAGCGILTELDLSGDIEYVDNIIISNISGNEIETSYLSGCDCQNSSTLDCLNICGGENDFCLDCAGVIDGDSILDCSGVCNGDSIVCSIGDVCTSQDNCNDLLAIQTIIDANSSLFGELPENLADWNDQGRAIRLNLANKEITTIPSTIDDLTELKQLFLSYNNISFLTYNIGNLEKLEHLSLSFNSLNDLPSTIGNLENLITLDVELNFLSSLPNEIGNLSNLLTLNVANNELSDLPNLSNLDKLENLYVNYNSLSYISSSITLLESLRILNVANNQLTDLPFGLCDMNSLELLSIAGNQICEPLESSCAQIDLQGEDGQNCSD